MRLVCINLLALQPQQQQQQQQEKHLQNENISSKQTGQYNNNNVHKFMLNKLMTVEQGNGVKQTIIQRLPKHKQHS